MVFRIRDFAHRADKRWLGLCAATVLMATATGIQAQGQYYRYVNKDGVKVMASSIPPEYAKQGYEVIGPNGRVIQTVEPAPPPEDIERVERERAILAAYEALARRYSTVDDIYAARDRRLAHLDANISILRGNINNLNSQIEDLMKRAANIEREGRQVPQHVFDSIDAVRDELADTEDLLRERLDEHGEIHDKFDDDVELFKQGKALEKEKTASALDQSG